MFYKIINLIKVNLKFNNKVIVVNLLNSDFNILKIFIKLNIIKSIKLVKNNKYMIILNNESAFKNFKNLYKPSNPVRITLKNIIKNNKNNKNILYISSTKGIINNIEAENKKVGGLLILQLFM